LKDHILYDKQKTHQENTATPIELPASFKKKILNSIIRISAEQAIDKSSTKQVHWYIQMEGAV